MLTQKAPTRPPPATAVYWLITRGRGGRSEAMTIGGGERRLPIFSFRKEAEAFMPPEALGAGWNFRRTTAWELASILMGPCVGVCSVALDPMPEHEAEGMLGLVSMGRERFLRCLVGEARLESHEARSPVNPGRRPSNVRCRVQGGESPERARGGNASGPIAGSVLTVESHEVRRK